MSKINKADLFDTGAGVNSNGKKVNWTADGQPSETLMRNWADSILWFTEADSRAKQKTASELDEDLVGHVQIETDVLAKANTDGLASATTTKVVHAGQLPTVVATDSQSVTGTDPFTGVVLAIAVDGTTTRNNYLAKLSTSFLAWFQALKDKVYTHDTSISTNTSDIATNVTDIGTNTADIATNVTNIGTNTTTGSTNAVNISTNSSNIATNVTNIGTNTTNVGTNTTDIATNVTDIATNVTDIATNLASIGVLNGKVGAMTQGQLALPVWDMDANATATVTHGLSASELLTISNISVTIFPDSGTNIYALDFGTSLGVVQGGINTTTSTNINLDRLAGGAFDAVGFSALATSRGFVRFWYIAD